MIALDKLVMRTGVTLTFLGIVVGTGVIAIAFFSAACYLALAEPLGTAYAAFATGCILIAVAAFLVLGVKLVVLRSSRPKAAATQPDGRIAAAKIGEMLGEEAGAWTKQHPGAAVLAALAAGFVVGSSPKLRNGLRRLLG